MDSDSDTDNEDYCQVCKYYIYFSHWLFLFIFISKVCFEVDSTTSSPLIECNGCGISVHCECYGVLSINNNNNNNNNEWLCDVCKFKQSTECNENDTEINVKCCLCPNKNGALKQTNKGQWAHIFWYIDFMHFSYPKNIK